MTITPYTMDSRRMVRRVKTLLETEPDLLWDASYGIGYGTAPAVASWASKRGSVTLVQATASRQPQYVAMGIGNRPSIIFDGGDWLSTPDALGISGSIGTIMIVFEQTTATGAQMLASFNVVANANKFLSFGMDTGVPLVKHNAGAALDRVDAADAIAAGAHVFMAGTNAAGTEWWCEIDGVAQTLTASSGTNSGEWYDEVNAVDRFNLGNTQYTVTDRYYGAIAQVAIWNRAA